MRPPVVRVGSVASTQAVAFELAERGAADGTAVVAEHQTAGRGRRGARWEDEPGSSLLLSIVLRPALEPARLPMLSYAAAVAVAEALASVAPVSPRLKWPNDVLVGSRKIAGILLETRLGRGPVITILGIGVNLGQRRFVGALADRATSVALETGLTVDREVLLTALLDGLDAWRRRLEAEGFDVVRRRWIELSDTLGREVTVDGARGVARDVDAEGALILDTAGGRHRVLAGALES